MRIARVTVDLMRPVPVAPLTIESEVLREGRKIQLCAVRLLAEGVIVVGATVLKIKVQANELPPEAAIEPVELAGAGAVARRARGFFVQPVRDRHVAARRPRPVRRARSGRDLVSRRPADRGRRAVSQAMRAMAAADFCNGTSSVLDFREWTFLNADLTVNFSREPAGDWILVDAEILDRPRRRGARHGAARR